MNNDPVLDAVIEDIRRIRAWCSAKSASVIPQAAVDYLAENAEVIAFFISAVYDGATEQEREQLYNANRGTLDHSVIPAGNREIAESALKEAIHQAAPNSLAETLDDDVVVLDRVLQYAKHIPGPPCPIAVANSPIKLK